MKIGYPCINKSVGCTANSTFRLASYSEEKLIEKVSNNLNCLENILKYNIENNLLFFRISSDIVPFASHSVCKFNWQLYFKEKLTLIGNFIKKNNIRISMHPDQFVLINAQKSEIVENSIKELFWQCELLDIMGLDASAKIQIHIGGVYGDKKASLERFVDNYQKLPPIIKKRVCIENDDRYYSLQDCLSVFKKTGIPIIFDSFHHQCNNNGEALVWAIEQAQSSWKKSDGVLMVDYSSQQPQAKTGKHITHIDEDDFTKFIETTKDMDFDVMLEIKDKEKSATVAKNIIRSIRSIRR